MKLHLVFFALVALPGALGEAPAFAASDTGDYGFGFANTDHWISRARVTQIVGTLAALAFRRCR